MPKEHSSMRTTVHSPSVTKNRFVQAACVYAGCKLVLSTVIFTQLCGSCSDFSRYMFYTTFRIILVTVFIFVGFRITAKIIAITNAGRSVLYLMDFAALTTAFQIPFLDIPLNPFYNAQGNPALLVSAALTGAVAFFLARAGWSPVPAVHRDARPVHPDHTINWTDEALKRVWPVPFFLRKIIERRARKMGIETITLDALD